MKDRLDRYKRVFGTEDGKEVLREMATECGLLSPHVRQGKIDPYYIAFKEGERNAVLRILSALEYTVNDFREIARPRRD